MYSTVNGNGDRAMIDCDQSTLITVPLGIVFTHSLGPPVVGVTVKVEDNATLTGYLDGALPVGDVRSLAGLLSVIYGPRDQLYTTIRQYMISGRRHGDSEWGYCKLWLYVIGFFQMSEQVRAAGDPGMVMGLRPGFAPPLQDNPCFGRANFDANATQINNDEFGWFFVPDGVSDSVVDAMADFFRPFPSCTWQNANYKPAAWRNDLPGLNGTMCNRVVSGPPVAPPPIPVRAALPTVAEYLHAIRLMAAYRGEDGSCVRGLSLAMHLASGVRCELAPDFGNGIAGEDLCYRLLPLRTLHSFTGRLSVILCWQHIWQAPPGMRYLGR
jgi:hypothetical protein